MIVEVDCGSKLIGFAGAVYPCVIGRGGSIEASRKIEGDGCTPLGQWPVRAVLLKPGTGYEPPLAVPWRWLRAGDGWCDDPENAAYNRPVALPFEGSAETLYRVDHRYDAIVVIGHNDAPPVRGAGSAIFLHLRGGPSTEGCVAFAPDVMARLLHAMAVPTIVRIGDTERPE